MLCCCIAVAGQERQQGDARFLCLVAEALPSSSSSSQSSDGGEDSQLAAASSGSSVSQAADSPGSHAARPLQAAAEAAAAASSGGGGPARVAVRDFLTPAGAQADSVDLGPLVAALARLAFPPSMRQDYGASYSSAGLCGAVVIDTLGDFVPPKRRRMPNGTLRCGTGWRGSVPSPRRSQLAPCPRRLKLRCNRGCRG